MFAEMCPDDQTFKALVVTAKLDRIKDLDRTEPFPE